MKTCQLCNGSGYVTCPDSTGFYRLRKPCDCFSKPRGIEALTSEELSRLRYPISPVICSFNLFEELRDRFPKRQIIPDPSVAYGEYYYFSRNGRVRKVVSSNGSIWVMKDEKPTFMKKIRAVSWLGK